jgi:nucleotide-binding universal stress UspA family protein
MPPGPPKSHDVKTILVPTDFSESSHAALEHATVLATAFKAKIVVLHVIESIAATMAETMRRVDTGAMLKNMSQSPQVLEVYALVRRAVEPALDKVVQDLRKAGVSASRELAEGSAYEQIVAHGRSAHADLIVMGTHGRRGVNRLFMGSVAERVVRLAPCPVLTVRPPHPGDAPPA